MAPWRAKVDHTIGSGAARTLQKTEGSGNLAFHQGKIAEQSTICGSFHEHEPTFLQRGHRIGHNTERAKDHRLRKCLI
jgi:hypothetical protein